MLHSKQIITSHHNQNEGAGHIRAGETVEEMVGLKGGRETKKKRSRRMKEVIKGRNTRF